MLLDGLSVLELLDELHLKHFHLHDLLLLGADNGFFLAHTLLHFLLGLVLLPPDELFFLKKRDPLLLLHHLVLDRSILRSLAEENLLSLLVLHLDEPLLLHFLFLAQVDGLLDLLPLLVPLLSHFIDFLLVFILHHLLHTKLFHLLMDLVLILLLQRDDLSGSFLSLLNLLPGTHLLLLEEGDSVGQQLGVSLDAILIIKLFLS